MRFRKRIAVMLCAAMVFNTMLPVSAAETEKADTEFILQESTDPEEIQEIKDEVKNNISGMDHTSGSFEEGVEFIMLADATLENHEYMLKSPYGSVSQDNYSYIAENGSFRYILTDPNGKKIKGLKKDEIQWLTYGYESDKKCLTKNPESVPVSDGVIQCGTQFEKYNCTIFVFAIYNGKVAMSTLKVTRPTKYFGQHIGKKFITKANASGEYHVGELINIDNIQKLVGTTEDTAIIYYFDREKVSGNNGYSYKYWAVPETASLNRTPNRSSDLISRIRKGGYAIKMNKLKNVDAVYNRYGSVVAFRPKKKGIYKVTYTVPDSINKKFTVKIRVR